MPSPKQIHLIANAHIDPVWLWDWREGLREILATFAAACSLIEEHAEYRFTASSASFYRRVQELDPPLLERIRQHVAEKRWAVVGGWWVEPDVNIPCGEALIRQGVYGKRFFHTLLGCDVKVAFNPDTFGHPEGLPKILGALGQDTYVFMRPGEREKPLPPLFRWRSADGSEVLAIRVLYGYGSDGQELVRKLRRLWELLESLDLPALACFYGTGDHGGGPGRESLRILEEVRRQGAIPLVHSDPIGYREAVRAAEGQLPVVQDELQHHARGCYSVNRRIKLRNRRAEHALLAMERWAALAWRVLGERYPQEPLEAHWQELLFWQFHDVLAGTCIEAA
ncbi:MAG: alpha-mannosidase, partial [candidate division KSB1 bacterium]|nr:alpha-mannosidase [candidate division KSB1 bacterium]